MQRELEPELMDTVDEAAAYDAMDHSIPNTAFVERLLELLSISEYLKKFRKGQRAGEAARRRIRVLDLGTGNGLIPLMLVDRLSEVEVVGVDLATHMLEVAERRRADALHRDRLSFEVADVKALPYEDGAFDVVMSNTILHHIPEPREMLTEAWRVLASASGGGGGGGGVLLIRDLFRPADDEAVEQLVQAHAGDESPDAQQLFRQSLKAALTPDELRAIVDELGWTNVEITIDSDRHASIQTRGT